MEDQNLKQEVIELITDKLQDMSFERAEEFIKAYQMKPTMETAANLYTAAASDSIGFMMKLGMGFENTQVHKEKSPSTEDQSEQEWINKLAVEMVFQMTKKRLSPESQDGDLQIARNFLNKAKDWDIE